MVEELKTPDDINVYWRQQAEIAVANFRRKRLRAEYVPDRHAAREKVLSLIPPGASIGRGDSLTLDQIGVMPILKQSGKHEIFNPFDWDGPRVVGEARLDLQRRAMTADIFLSGANAITMDGRVVATDSTGNRVAPMIFGPKKIIIVAGVNKLVPNLEAAFKRIHSFAAPVNFRQHYHSERSRDEWSSLPCVKAGSCPDCAHAARGCNYSIIIEGSRETPPQHSDEHTHRHNIILIGEPLGL
ncbi:MAG: lactate utilization protein [Chloroflexi bacterium]|nr:lactate utilization protein [Chloroflexota bacterium]